MCCYVLILYIRRPYSRRSGTIVVHEEEGIRAVSHRCELGCVLFSSDISFSLIVFFFQAEDGIRGLAL